MKALVFHQPGKVSVDNVPFPKIQHQEDVILRVTVTAICGSDVHIYNGFVPQKEPMVMGHEFMGVVEEVGSGVTQLKPGERVVVPFPVACGACFFCDLEMPCHCEHSNPERYGPEGMKVDRTVIDKLSNVFHAQVGLIKVLVTVLSTVRRGGVVSVVGVYGMPYDNFPLGQIFDKGITLKFGQVPVHKYIDELLGLVEDRKIRLDDIITHRMPLDEVAMTYDLFNKREDGCVKVVLTP